MEETLRGRNDADKNKNAPDKVSVVSNVAKPPVNNDKNTEMNKNAQNDIKNALQNKKVNEANTNTDDTKDDTNK